MDKSNAGYQNQKNQNGQNNAQNNNNPSTGKNKKNKGGDTGHNYIVDSDAQGNNRRV